MQVTRLAERLLSSIGGSARAFSVRAPWGTAYGLARSVIACGTLLTLIVNPAAYLFRPLAGVSDSVGCSGAAVHLSLFCLASPSHLDAMRYVAILILAVVASGWRPRYTGALHWWISSSLWISGRVTDGGDQIAAVVTLLLLPLTLTDDRAWHWHTPTAAELAHCSVVRKLVGSSAVLSIRVQMGLLYFHSCIAKFAVPEWTDGTAMYYWFNDNYTGLPGYLRPLFEPLLHSPMVALLTWSVLLLELLLASALFWPLRARRALLPVALAFHLGIAWFLGIFSFAIAMMGALLIYLSASGDSISELFPVKITHPEIAGGERPVRLQNV